MCSQPPGSDPAPAHSFVMRLPSDPWYLPVARAVATEIAARSGFTRDSIAEVRIVVTEVAAAVCTAPGPDSTAELTFTPTADGLRILGKVMTQQSAPLNDSAPLMRLLRQVADDVVTVCSMDRNGGMSLRVTATTCPPAVPQ